MPEGLPGYNPNKVSAPSNQDLEQPSIEHYSQNLTEQQARKIADIDALQPTDDPSVDGLKFDALTNHGRRAHKFQETTNSLRSLVITRDILRDELAGGHLDPSDSMHRFLTLYYSKQLEVLDRLLAHHHVAVDSMDEFDDLEIDKEGSGEKIKLRGLESFTPTGNLRNDLLVFAAITNQTWLAQLLTEGVDPIIAAGKIKEWNSECIALGVNDSLIAEARYWTRHIAPLENAMLERILAAYQQ